MATNSKASKVNYERDIRAEALKPIAERKAIVRGRAGLLVPPRNYSLTPHEIGVMRKQLAAWIAGDKVPVTVDGETQEVKATFPNPYGRVGAYNMAVGALATLGIDKWHSFDTVYNEMKTIGSDPESKQEEADGSTTTAWQRFYHRAPRSKKSARDIDGRIFENFKVLQRLGGNNPYGLKLKQLGLSIAIAPANSEPNCKDFKVMLSTDESYAKNPFNGFSRKARKGVVVAPGQPKPVASTPKVSKPKAKKASKPKAKVVETAVTAEPTKVETAVTTETASPTA